MFPRPDRKAHPVHSIQSATTSSNSGRCTSTRCFFLTVDHSILVTQHPHQTDKKGRPLNIHHFGRINTTELYKGSSPERFWHALLSSAESLTREVLPAASVAAGRHIDGTLVVADLTGFGYVFEIQCPQSNLNAHASLGLDNSGR